MELVIKHFNELTNAELYDILKARVDVLWSSKNVPTPKQTVRIRTRTTSFCATKRGLRRIFAYSKAGCRFPNPRLGAYSRRGAARVWERV